MSSCASSFTSPLKEVSAERHPKTNCTISTYLQPAEPEHCFSKPAIQNTCLLSTPLNMQSPPSQPRPTCSVPLVALDKASCPTR